MRNLALMLTTGLLLVTEMPGQEKNKVDELLQQAKTALQAGKADEALALTNKAVEAAPKEPRTYLFRGMLHASQRRHADALADFDKCIELDAKLADAYQHRGGEWFKIGKIDKSLADFDKFLELRPDERPGHWQRGISLYYAGKFEEGAKQFKAGDKVFGDDVENAVWHYLCNAKVVGAVKARAALLKIGKDKRVPMMTVYELFAGRAKPEVVMVAVQEGKPIGAELKNRLFYAHLYLGLYYDATGDKRKALDHMKQAADDEQVGGYMGDVARVHLKSMAR